MNIFRKLFLLSLTLVLLSSVALTPLSGTVRSALAACNGSGCNGQWSTNVCGGPTGYVYGTAYIKDSHGNTLATVQEMARPDICPHAFWTYIVMTTGSLAPASDCVRAVGDGYDTGNICTSAGSGAWDISPMAAFICPPTGRTAAWGGVPDSTGTWRWTNAIGNIC